MISTPSNPHRSPVRDDRGSVMGEYALLFALITVALLITIGLFTDGITNTLQAIIDVLP